ncbi:STAS domain-containing protein [Streptacidiphilus albus]|uniref:STAS domain-containing protein n=1 Tax=Streptacidiphilus albus TaxID=105425 RepID=UPI0007C6FC5F|nr:STAS domain-containing protein [Streptacidiphilus albus]
MPIPHRLDHYRRDTHDLALIALVGEIDLDSAPRLRTVLEQCLREGMSTIDVDLTAVAFCDCHGLGVLIDASQQAFAAGGGLRLSHPSAAVARLLALTGTDCLLSGRPVDAATSPRQLQSAAPRHRVVRRAGAAAPVLTAGVR